MDRFYLMDVHIHESYIIPQFSRSPVRGSSPLPDQREEVVGKVVRHAIVFEKSLGLLIIVEVTIKDIQGAVVPLVFHILHEVLELHLCGQEKREEIHERMGR